jgi:hypothetical protein
MVSGFADRSALRVERGYPSPGDGESTPGEPSQTLVIPGLTRNPES